VEDRDRVKRGVRHREGGTQGFWNRQREGEQGVGSDGNGKRREGDSEGNRKKGGEEQGTEWRQREIQTGHGEKESETGLRKEKKKLKYF
jgi:hypothetical protein